MHILNVNGGIFFNQGAAEKDAENRNRFPVDGDPFVVVGLAQQNTFIGWTVMLSSEVPKAVPA